MLIDFNRFFIEAFQKHRGLFITGTDTGVGKTYVGCAIAQLLKGGGLSVGVFKPAECGGDQDIRALRKAAACSDPMELCLPYRLKRSLAPWVAAKLEGTEIRLPVIQKAHKALLKRHDGVLVEGAGGVLVPYHERLDGAGLARALGHPAVVVARPGLGSINHTLLTLEALRSRGVEPLCVMLNGLKGKPGPAESTNPSVIARLGRVVVFGPLPWRRA
jgi:dethiobiotin synthetase